MNQIFNYFLYAGDWLEPEILELQNTRDDEFIAIYPRGSTQGRTDF